MFEFPFLIGTPWPWWLIVAGAGGVGVLTLKGYKRRAQELKPKRLRLLKVLRLGAWGLLFFCLLQPIHRTFIREKRASRVAILVDASESMSFSDRTGGPSRLASVQDWLGKEEDENGFKSNLERSFDVKMESFAGGAKPIPDVSALKADGEQTNLARALTDAFGRLKGPGAGGLVLISDGADTARGEIVRAAKTYRRAGIPIYALGVGATHVADLAISQVRCRRTVSKDTLIRVEVEVTRDGIPPGSYPVRITRNGKTIKEAAVDLKGENATAIFEFLPSAQGFLEYEAKVDPYPGELLLANNTFSFGVVAFARKLRVLYMEGSQLQHGSYGRWVWRYKWEHEFMVDALEEDKDVEVDVLFREYPQDYQGDIKTVKEGYPKTKKDLYKYDVIINSDIPLDHFNEDQIKWTVDFVGKYGGGFIMIGGWNAFGEGGYAKSAFDRMLPVEMNRHDKHADGQDFLWRITGEGLKHPIMKIDKDPKKNRAIWEKLNTLEDGGASFHGYSKTVRAKPAATVLAEIDDEELEGYAGAMVLVSVQPFGRGRSMAFTTDCTGGWGASWEDSWGDDQSDPDRRNLYYKTFWKNTIRWLAHYRMKAPNQLVQIETEKLVYGRGEIPVARVKVLTRDYDPTHEAKVQLEVTAPSGLKRRVNVFPRYEEPGVYERNLEINEVGRYQLTANAEWKGEDLGEDKAILQVRPATLELRALSQDEKMLRKIAEESGGAYLSFKEKDDLMELLRQDTHVVQRHRDDDLWDRWWMFALIIGALCFEWFFRKKSGLP